MVSLKQQNSSNLKGETVPERRGIQVPVQTFDQFTHFKIQLAGEIGEIPTHGEMINALVKVGKAHLTEVVTAIKREK